MRFVVFWLAITEKCTEWLYVESKLVDYSELNRVSELGIFFVTIRWRGAVIVRRLAKLPPSSWSKPVIDTPSGVIRRSAIWTRRFALSAEISQFVRSRPLVWDVTA
jgi:hypothetical protein